MRLAPRVFGAPSTGLRLERVRASKQFKGERFENTTPVKSPVQAGRQSNMAREFLFGGRKRRPAVSLPTESPLEAWQRPASSGLRVTWLGHSTTLLEVDGVRVLTDPVWGERASPSQWVGPRRFHDVPVSVAGLPPLDAVLVSHDHYDHLDYPAMRELSKLDVPFVTSLGVGAHLESWGIAPERITELDWWESAAFPSRSGGGVRFTATPARHFSGRGLGSANLSLWSSFALETDQHKVFFSGDTGLTRELETIGQKLGPFDLVMLEVGAWHPAWGSIHLGPRNALRAHAMLGGGTLVPVHWGTFDLGLHPWDEPAETLLRLAASLPEKEVRLITPRLGRPLEPAHTETTDPWWREITGKTADVPEIATALAGDFAED
jgi:L-ascorbate metabolism protein UlaG (beta-lactamase superfamily)